MTFRISDVNKPELFIDEIFPLLNQVGELPWSALHDILAEHRQKSYIDDYVEIGNKLGLWTQHNRYLIHTGEFGTNGEFDTSVLFDFLSRLPHFARWLQLRAGGLTPDAEDICISDELRLDFITNRRSMLRNWEEAVWSEVNDRSGQTQTLNSTPLEIHDDYLYYKSKTEYDEIQCRRCLLGTLIGAQQNNAGVVISNFCERLSISEWEVNEIVENVFKSLGLEIEQQAGVAYLLSDLTYTIPSPTKFAQAMDSLCELGGSTPEFSRITSAIPADVTKPHPRGQQLPTSTLQKQDRDRSYVTIDYADVSVSPGDVRAKFYDGVPASDQLEIIPHLPHEIPQQQFIDEVDDLLHRTDQPSYRRSGSTWSLWSLLTAHYQIGGTFPMVRPGWRIEHTIFGSRAREGGPDQIREQLQLGAYSCSEVIRLLSSFAAADNQKFVIRRQGEPYVEGPDGEQEGMLSAVDRAKQDETTLLYPVLSREKVTEQVVSLLEAMGVLEQSGFEYNVTNSYRRTLEEHGLLGTYTELINNAANRWTTAI